jgi:hypothetical protein
VAVGEADYRLVGRRTEGRFTLLSQQLADGGRAALVFCGTVAAEAFRIVEGLEEEWEVIEGATDEIAHLLAACAATGVRYVCLDPPTALTRGSSSTPRVIPLTAFLDHLLDEPDHIKERPKRG